MNNIEIVEIVGPGVFASMEGLTALFPLGTVTSIKTLGAVNTSVLLGFHQPDRISFITNSTAMFVTVSLGCLYVSSSMKTLSQFLCCDAFTVKHTKMSGDYIDIEA